MSRSPPALFPALPPHRVPGSERVRLEAGSELLASLAEYVAAAASLSEAQSVAILGALLERVREGTAAPVAPQAPAPRFPAQPLLADDAAHDRYFHVRRIAAAEGSAFLRTILLAAVLFHSELASRSAAGDPRRFAAVAGGLTALLGYIAGLPLAPVEHAALDEPAAQAAFDAMHRWIIGHQIFAALTQGIIFSLQEFEAAVRDRDEARARQALKVCADLMLASASAFHFTADFPPAAYTDVVRPSMMGQAVGEGFSGLLSVDHRRLVATLVRIRPLMAQTAQRLAAEHERLKYALDQVYGDHKYVCARFVGTEQPSLRCPNASPLSGVEQLDRYQRSRMELLRPHSDADPIILG
jgi:hypothetical protein